MVSLKAVSLKLQLIWKGNGNWDMVKKPTGTLAVTELFMSLQMLLGGF